METIGILLHHDLKLPDIKNYKENYKQIWEYVCDKYKVKLIS
jgi:hypothetical protein